MTAARIFAFHRLIVFIVAVQMSIGGSAGAAEPAAAPRGDWLVDPSPFKASATTSDKDAVLSNGLLRRVIRVAPNAATVELTNLATNESLLRGVKPEATLKIDGTDYNVGGLTGQPDYAYLAPHWLEALKSDPTAMQFTGIRQSPVRERLAWKRTRHSPDVAWPPPGAGLVLSFAPPKGKLDGVTVEVHYEMYDGLPLIAKWITLRNGSAKPIRLQNFTAEILAVVEVESSVDRRTNFPWILPAMTVISDYTFGGMDAPTANKTTYWQSDPQYGTQVNYGDQTPCLLVSRPPMGPDAMIEPGKEFETFTTFELIHDNTDRERQSLAIGRMYRTIAPWCRENPSISHVISSDPKVLRTAIDNAQSVGFEMVILSFGSGFNIESEDPKYIEQVRGLAEYAHSKGIMFGGYGLLASRSAGKENNVVLDHAAWFGQSPCLGSPWGINYFKKLRSFIEKTGIDVFEHDGSYPGDPCKSTTHPGHRGYDDSQWAQWRQISDFYKWCRGRGVYLNVPDFYFLSGSNKTGMGYKEHDWDLPRAQQIIHARQNIFDGTWDKTNTMGWMFVPLTQYHGGGAAATIEPLSQHLPDYEAHMANLFGTGVQACYRGPRLFDTPETQAVIKKWVDFYKQHRAILDSDFLHLRRADGRNIDMIMHVNPQLAEKGLVMIYNPLETEAVRDVKLPLYYTGLTDTALVQEQNGEAKRFTLARDYSVTVPVKIPARSCTWLVIKQP